MDGDRGLPKAVSFVAGIGITGMRERVKDFGGVLEISSDENGTHVRAVFPRLAESRRTNDQMRGHEKTSAVRTSPEPESNPNRQYLRQQAVLDALVETRRDEQIRKV